MNKVISSIFAFVLFCALTSCAENLPSTSSSATVTLQLASTSTQTLTQTLTPTLPPTPTPTTKKALEDFQNKVLVGEDTNYSIYMINRAGGTDAAPKGELLVYDKSTNQVIKMNGLFTVIINGGTIVYDDGKGEYVLLSIGSYSSRTAIVLSLEDQKQAVNDFCISSGQYGGHIFWNDYIVINNCDTFTNRPWGNGEAPSVIAINLKTGTETVIAKSDLTHQFQIKIIEGNNLRYIETYVENENDWNNMDKQKAEEKIFDLSSLNNSN